MELNKQVVSLDLAKRLKELGVKQESLFWWEFGGELDGATIRLDEEHDEEWINGYDHISAFTFAELGEMLPPDAISAKTEYDATDLGAWACALSDKTANGQGYFLGYGVYADTEADARAKMLIYLLENKLITF